MKSKQLKRERNSREVIVLGLMYSDSILEEAKYNSMAGIQMAPHIFQQNLLKGFESRSDIDLKVITVPPIGSYPIHYKKAVIHDDKWKRGYQQLGYINVPVVKHAIQKQKIINLIEKEVDDNKDQYILIYTVYPPFVKAAATLKKKYPGLHICLLQTDPIPGKDGIYTKNTAHNIRKGEKIISLMKSFDSFVVLTKYLAEAMETGSKPYTLVDCIINNDSLQETVVEAQHIAGNRFLYTGSTRSTNGIITLVDAFKYLPEAELWICGSGDSDEYIRERENSSSNIKFFGSIDHSRIAEVQAQCDFMINPRTPTGGFTKYSFPSKTAEYMMTGKPTVMYKLEGLSEDYDSILNYVYSEDPKGLADELRELMVSDRKQLLEKATKAKDYVMSQKSPEAQASRIIAMWDKNR